MRASRNEKAVSVRIRAIEDVSALKVPPARVESVIRALDEAEDKAGAAPCGMNGGASSSRGGPGGAPSRRGVRPGPSRSAQA